jgi:membrane protease YdiL (CAAX protease family)
MGNADDLRSGRRVRTHKTGRRLARAHGVLGLARLLETPARDCGRLHDSALLWTVVLLLIGSALIAPVVEEAYFRGYLLPRMPVRLGRTAPLAHAVLSRFTTCGPCG